MSPEINPFVLAQQQFNRAADAMGLEPDIRAILSEPERELHVSLPIDMRMAAYIVAVRRIADTMRLRGLPL
jgi:glutamate dehydrogenase/leucine dehydrogenase